MSYEKRRLQRASLYSRVTAQFIDGLKLQTDQNLLRVRHHRQEREQMDPSRRLAAQMGRPELPDLVLPDLVLPELVLPVR